MSWGSVLQRRGNEETRKQRALAGWSREQREGSWLPWRLRASPGCAFALMSQTVDAGLSCGPSPCPAPADVPPPSCGRESQPSRWCCSSDSPACPKRAHGGPRPTAPHPPKASAAGWQSRPSRKIVRSWCQPPHQAAKTSASNSRTLATAAVDVVCFFMVLLPFWISLPAPIDRARQHQPQSSFFTIRRDIREEGTGHANRPGTG